MTTPSATTPSPAPGQHRACVLLVAADASDAESRAHAELAQRLSARLGVDAIAFPLGPRAHAELTAVMERAPGRVVAVPLSLTPSDPLLPELAGLLRWASAWWPDVPMFQSAPLAAPDDVVGWAAQQVRAALDALTHPSPRAETAVLVVGPGGAPPAVNAELCAVARLLWEHGDYALVETAFVHDGPRPSVAARIAHCGQLGMRRVVVLPLALLDGLTVRAVRAQASSARHATSHATSGGAHDMEVVVAAPLLSPAAAAAVAGRRYEDAVARWLAAGDDAPSRQPGQAPDEPAPLAGDALLPPRYRGTASVSAAPMRSAALRYDAEGRVAWNQVWQSFCDLALAGGPPHRGTLLEPALREDVLADPEGYARVVAELARGLSLVTGLPVITGAAPGWVGLICADHEMAIWLLRALTVENVSVRREGATLFLPAGPQFRVEKEIRNVVTAVAKTHHYWAEHRTPS
ncbi:MAG TPA: CbiX/SirB N-terminal domain-containing protein [Gemmatimonadaceae bacterium]|nr:CbiX/SirB N-terminal domain-containing protein [Gemmatimonadaceae bacterium]